MDNLRALYTTTDGRISRKQWWIGLVGIIIASILVSIILYIIGVGLYGWGQIIGFLVLIYPSYCIGIKRRQDRDNSGLDYKIMVGLTALMTVLQAFNIGMTPTDIGNGMVVMSPNGPMLAFQAVVGIFGLYVLIQLGFLRGTPGSNSYGPDPLGYAITA